MRAGRCCTAGQRGYNTPMKGSTGATPTHHVADERGGLNHALAARGGAGALLLLVLVAGRRERYHLGVRAAAGGVNSTDMGDAERLSDLSVEVGVEGGDAGHVVEGGFSEVLVEHGRWLLIDAAVMP